ncbi:isocitrate lyase/phosphoenolpyruvate mutase family protein [Actinoplanes sp. NPDC000266]
MTTKHPLRALGAANAIAASVAAEAGFDALWISGLEVSTSMGLPDENVLTAQDLAGVVLAVGRVTDLPAIVDVDNGGGSPASARRTATDLAKSGAAGLCVEDSLFPKINSFATHRDQHLASIDSMCGLLTAMRAAAGDSMTLIARTETLICGGSVGDALQRASLYVGAGADAVLIHSKDRAGKQARDVAGAWSDGRTPLVSIPTAFPQLGVQELGAAGYSLVIYANQLTRAAYAAMRAAADAFTATGTFTAQDGSALPSVQELLQISDRSANAVI